MSYSKENLEEGIEKCKANIVIFEEAIEKERGTIKEYRMMIEESERMANVREVVAKGVKIEAE